MTRHYAYVEILGDSGSYNQFPFKGEFHISSIEQIKSYMKGLAEAEGLKSYQVVIDGEVYLSTGEVSE